MADHASEQTLQELLQQAQQMNASLTKLSNVLGKGSTASPDAAKGAKEASENMNNLNSGMSKFLPTVSAASGAFGVLSVAVGAVSKIFGVLGGMISGLFDKIGKVAGILGEFAMVAASGQMKLSNMVDVMGDLAEQIPLVGGLFSALIMPMKMVIQRQEESLEMFRDMAKVGAGVGQSLETLRVDARSTGLSMEEYGRVIKANGQIFASMGGDVQSGVKMFNKNMNALMGSDSEISRAMFGMGYTTEEAAGAMAAYMRSQGSLNKQGLQDSKATAQSALELAQQMQLLSETTGKSRQMIQEELEASQREQNWQAYIATLAPEEAKKATEKLNYALATGGKDAGDMLKTKLMTGITLPLTESQKRQDAIMGGGLSRLVDGIGNATGSVEEMGNQFARSRHQYAVETDQAVKDVGMISALQVAKGEKGLISAEQIANRNRMLEDGKVVSAEKAMKDEAERRQRIKDAGATDAASIAQQTQNLRTFGNVIDGLIGMLTGPFLKPFLDITGKFQDIATTLAKDMQPTIQKFSDWFTPWVNKFTSIKSWDEFKIVMFAFWEDIKKKAGPMVKELWESARPILAEGFSKLISFIWEAIKTAITPDWWNKLFGDSDKEKEKKQKEVESAQKELSRLKELKAEYEKKNPGKKWEETNVGSLGADRMKKLEATVSGTAPAPSVNNAQLVRDWAYSIMTKQADSAPASIAKEVDQVIKNPDETLKKSVDDYNAAIKQKAADEKARQEKEAAEAKTAAAKPTEKATSAPAAPAVVASEPKADAATTLNSLVSQLVRLNAETAEATKRTANLIASNGNLFRA